MARPVSFTVHDADVSRLAELRYQHPHPRIQQRCWFLWLVSRGLSVGQASALAGVSRITGWRYGETYREEGIEGVLCEHWEGPESGLAPHAQTLEAEFTRQPPHSVAEAAERIARMTGVHRKPEQVRQFLRNTLGLRWRRTAGVPCPPKKTSPSTPGSRPSS